MSAGFILLLDVDPDLFTRCFGMYNEWAPFRVEVLDKTASPQQVSMFLTHPSLKSVVIQDLDTPHWTSLYQYHQKGGFIAFFGIYGDFNIPTRLSEIFGCKWVYNTYEKHDYMMTVIGMQYLGNAVTMQPYVSAHLINAPEYDQLMCGKIPESLEQYMKYTIGKDPSKTTVPQEEIDQARSVGYPMYCRDMKTKSPLVMHVDPKTNGRICYIGFVSSDTNIPMIVQSLLTGTKTRNEYLPER